MAFWNRRRRKNQDAVRSDSGRDQKNKKAAKREIQDRLREIEPAPVRVTDPDAVVDTILKGLTDASRLFEHGSMEERKRAVRTFVEMLTLNGESQTGELRIKTLPMPTPRDTGSSSFKSLAGVLYEVQKRVLGGSRR